MAFQQTLVATSRRSGVPLIYPEAVLFPIIFWACATDLSMIGSIPNVFLQDNATLHALGFPSLYDTLRTRMLDPSLLCSSDRNYQFYAWDNITNLGLRGASTETVLRRGWADMTGYEGIRMRDEKDAVYDSYSIESRATVNQISASNARYPAVDMFFTWTCNQRKTFGIKKSSNTSNPTKPSLDWWGIVTVKIIWIFVTTRLNPIWADVLYYRAPQ
jgi:hypothetical protein